MTKANREKIALFGNLREDRVFSVPDVESIYTIPSILKGQKFDALLFGKLGIPYHETEKISLWEKALSENKHEVLTIGIVGKYTALEDSYSSVLEALKHAGNILGIKIEMSFIDARKKAGIDKIKKCNACIVPGGFGDTAVENMIQALTYIREEKIPCLGICLGLQLMVLEYLRNVLGENSVNSLEFDASCSPQDAITLLDNQKNITQLGGTMRLGKQGSKIKSGNILKLYKESGRLSSGNIVFERFRHRYEVNPFHADMLSKSNLHITGVSKRLGIVQFIEMNSTVHPYYIATQSHPELTSKLEDPAPLFIGLIQACLKIKK